MDDPPMWMIQNERPMNLRPRHVTDSIIILRIV